MEEYVFILFCIAFLIAFGAAAFLLGRDCEQYRQTRRNSAEVEQLRGNINRLAEVVGLPYRMDCPRGQERCLCSVCNPGRN